jgi:hypothetical protein
MRGMALIDGRCDGRLGDGILRGQDRRWGRLRLPLQLQLLLHRFLQLPLLFKSPLSAPCRRCLKRIRCGVCLSAAQRSEFSRAPLQASTARGPRAAGRDHRGRLFLPIFFWRSKKSRSAAGTNTRPGHDDSAVVLGHPP